MEHYKTEIPIITLKNSLSPENIVLIFTQSIHNYLVFTKYLGIHIYV